MGSVYLKRALLSLKFVPPLVFVWMLMWVTYYPLKRRAARRRLATAGKDLGLHHEVATLRSEFGELKGTYDGRRVEVGPDRGLIAVYLRPRCAGDLVDIATGKCRTNTPQGQVDVVLGGSSVGRVFGTCRVQRQLQATWNEDTPLHQALLAFVRRYMWKLDGLSVNGRYITAQFTFGAPLHPYLPPERLDELLGAVSELATRLEPLVQPVEDTD